MAVLIHGADSLKKKKHPEFHIFWAWSCLTSMHLNSYLHIRNFNQTSRNWSPVGSVSLKQTLRPYADYLNLLHHLQKGHASGIRASVASVTSPWPFVMLLRNKGNLGCVVNTNRTGKDHQTRAELITESKNMPPVTNLPDLKWTRQTVVQTDEAQMKHRQADAFFDSSLRFWMKFWHDWSCWTSNLLFREEDAISYNISFICFYFIVMCLFGFLLLFFFPTLNNMQKSEPTRRGVKNMPSWLEFQVSMSSKHMHSCFCRDSKVKLQKAEIVLCSETWLWWTANMFACLEKLAVRNEGTADSAGRFIGAAVPPEWERFTTGLHGFLKQAVFTYTQPLWKGQDYVFQAWRANL